MIINIFLTNLGKYNEGYLIGEWMSLPVTKEEISEVIKRIGINEQYEEWFITDYECDVSGIEINMYDSIYRLNEIAEALHELEETDRKVVSALLEDGYTFDGAIAQLHNGDYRIYYDCQDMDDVAHIVIEECGYLNDVSEIVADYFDYSAFGRDLEIEGKFYYVDGDYIELF